VRPRNSYALLNLVSMLVNYTFDNLSENIINSKQDRSTAYKVVSEPIFNSMFIMRFQISAYKGQVSAP
jgi:hypothetical protein